MRGPKGNAASSLFKPRTWMLASLTLLLSFALVGGPLAAHGGSVEVFPATDVILVLDVSAGMGLPTELPPDFPNRERYNREIAQLLEAFYNREDSANKIATPTDDPSLRQRAKTVIDATRWLAELTAFQRDVETYTSNRQIDAEQLTRLAGERQAVLRTLDLLAAAQRVDGTKSRVGLVAYSDRIVTSVPLSDNRAAVSRALDSLTASSDSANIGLGLQAAINGFPSTAAAGNTKRQIILMSGSPASASGELERVATVAQQRNIAIDTIGVGPSAAIVGQDALVSVARASGGGYIFAPDQAVLSAAAVGFRAYATSNVLTRTQGSVARGQDVRQKLPVPTGSNALRISVSDLSSSAASNLARATAAAPTAPAAPGELKIALVDPDGNRNELPEGSSNRVVIGLETLITIPAPRPGDWQVELSVGRGAASAAVPFALNSAVDGVSRQRPLDLAPPGAGASPPQSGGLADNRWVQIGLWIATLLVALASLLFLVLSIRGLTTANASKPLGCCFGCFIPVLLFLLALAWAFVRMSEAFMPYLRALR